MRTSKVERRIIPPHNLHGDHGPVCNTCAGLGQVLRMPYPGGTPTRATTSCHPCKGTGIDQEMINKRYISNLVDKLERLERQSARDHKLLLELRSMTKHNGKMSRQYWSELIAWATVDGTAITNVSTEAAIMPAITILGGFMSDGRILEYETQGRIGATATPTVTLRLRWGGLTGNIIAQSAAITLAAVTAAIFELSFKITTRANGTAGSLFAIGKVIWGATIKTSNTPDMLGSAGATTPAAVANDLTVDASLVMSAQFSAASASNAITGHNSFLWAHN